MSSTAPSRPANTTPSINGDPHNVQIPKWKDPLQDWQTVCAAGLYNVTDVCCAAQNGSVWADNSTSFAGAGQHSCLLYTTNETNANASQRDFFRCVRDTHGASIASCDINKKSSAKRMAMGMLGLVWVAAGYALVL
ncbi:hypothetical protein Q8F55_001499 [Vanrija albida]|uniref:Extracellular membrane protein CFEM domain-containing protein n=1 Tax=Vanrija albida TaxID=181172 RepID=A0ABR3QGM4_9TREE